MFTVLSAINAAAVYAAAVLGLAALYFGPLLVGATYHRMSTRHVRSEDKAARAVTRRSITLFLVLQAGAVWLYLNGHAILRTMSQIMARD